MSESHGVHWLVCSCVFFSQCSWCGSTRVRTYKMGHSLLHKLTVRDHVPKVVYTCSNFSFEDLIWLQLNNLTFTAARSGEQLVMTGVRDDTETSDGFSVTSKNSLQLCMCESRFKVLPRGLPQKCYWNFAEVWVLLRKVNNTAEQQILLWKAMTTQSILSARMDKEKLNHYFCWYHCSVLVNP